MRKFGSDWGRLGMRCEWKDVRLGDICTKIGSGATPRGGKEVYKKEGISLIRSQNVLDFVFSPDGLVYIDDEQARKLGNVIVQSGDVLINITGDSVARVCLAPNEYLPARVNQHVAIVRRNPKLAEERFILYKLQERKAYLLSIASTGGTRNALTKSMLEELSFLCPSLPEQKAIAATLSCLDDKIELNNKTSANLVAQAQAIFKSWFVDFEPFQAGEFVDSELGWMPKGWYIRSLDDVCDKITDGSHFSPRHSLFGEYPMLSVKDMDNYGFNYKSCKRISYDDFKTMEQNGCVPQINDILVAKDGSYMKHVFIVNNNQPEAILSSIAIFRTNKSVIYPEILLYLLKDPTHQKNIKDNYVSGSALPRIVLKDFKKYKFALPPIHVQDKLILLFSSFRKRIELNQKQNETLAALRDTLLFKLMSGEIEVPITKDKESLKHD